MGVLKRVRQVLPTNRGDRLLFPLSRALQQRDGIECCLRYTAGLPLLFVWHSSIQ